MSNVKRVAHDEESTDNYSLTAIAFSSTKYFSVFQLIVWVLWPRFMFWFTLTDLIAFITSCSRQLFSVKCLINKNFIFFYLNRYIFNKVHTEPFDY